MIRVTLFSHGHIIDTVFIIYRSQYAMFFFFFFLTSIIICYVNSCETKCEFFGNHRVIVITKG